MLEEYTGEGANRNVEASYLYGNDLISQQQGMEEFFYVEDGHSGVRQLVDENGMVMDSYHYDAYGNVLSGTSEDGYLYRGEQFDGSLDLQYLRARYYDPTTGRFISTDPFEGNIEQPVSRHRYLYANANPVMNLDPSGLFTKSELDSANTIANILQLNSTAFNTALLGVGSIGLGQLVAGLMAEDGKEITWKGALVGGAGNIATTYAAGTFSADLTSEEYGYAPNDGQRARLRGVWLIPVAGISIGPFPLSITASFLELKLPRFFGINVGALSGGFLAGSIAGSTALGIGANASAVSMGFGKGWGIGGFFGYDISVATFTGFSIPIFREWLREPPTPIP